MNMLVNDHVTIALLAPRAMDGLGFIPTFFHRDDPRPAREQLDSNYAANGGGGWREFAGFTMRADRSIEYPGDPALAPLACIMFRNERIYVYPHAWVAIVQRDDRFCVARMD